YWFITYDNGSTWTKLGRATGENGKDGADGKDGQNGQNGSDGKDGADGKDGKDGDSVFSSVREDDNYVYVTLAGSGEEIAIPKNKPFSITFDYNSTIAIQPGKKYSIGYKIIGADEKTQIKVYSDNGLAPRLKKKDYATGSIEFTAPLALENSEIHDMTVLVNNGNDRTLMNSFNFVKGQLYVTNNTQVVSMDSQDFTVELTTNLDNYTISIPDEAKDWLSMAPQSRAVLRTDYVRMSVTKNSTGTPRYATIEVLDKDNEVVQTAMIYQSGPAFAYKSVTTAKAGELSSLLTADDKKNLVHLKVSGPLNSSDYSTINGITTLRTLDLSDVTTELIKGYVYTYSAGSNVVRSVSAGIKLQYVKNIILPSTITEIPEACFYDAVIENVVFPESLTKISESAFEGCSLLKDIVISNNVTSIGYRAFSSYKGTIIIGKSVESISAYAFSNVNRAYCKAINPPTINSSFNTKSKILTVPRGCREVYISSDWGQFFTYIQEVDFDDVDY
ncbi:MAG: leucine-rich repeat protein, partial [Muribaculaceae bacterium]|nr:leucine-rich repeat protein [Muribaculaceae bacterium]